jgi:Histidine kinase/Y_Y_Y domain
LWVGTNKGLNKIDVSKPALPVIKYSSSDGLPSDIINAVYAEDSLVYVGSPAGLTVFNETKISSYSICRLTMMGITVSGQQFDSLHTALSYKKNNIKFSYIGVSLKSAGDITYWYKLKGLNDGWIQTAQTTLDYPSLPPGDYELQLYAVNKYGIKSETITVWFSINAPFWKSVWFYILLALFTAALAGWIVHLRNKKYNRKLKETNALQKQFAAMEQQALQAQMNPHFIFNCLNGIQQYILTGNKEKANEYLTCFARLIRQTLDNSGQKTISVSQEAQYLTEYLEMEKMRSGNTFTYNISIDNNTDAAGTEIPAMLLQPYVENALRHGLRYKINGTGRVEINFSTKAHSLLCTVKDNGAGRKYAVEMKSKQHVEYQSKGMSLTARRIDLLNKINDAKMSVTINDLYNTDGTSAGTEVIIQIPL